MDTSPVFGLGYVRVWEADLAQWRQFAEGVLGMTAQNDGESRLLVRMDDWIGRFIVEEGRGPLRRNPVGPRMWPSAGNARARRPGRWRGGRSRTPASIRQGGSGPTAWCRDWFGCWTPAVSVASSFTAASGTRPRSSSRREASPSSPVSRAWGTCCCSPCAGKVAGLLLPRAGLQCP